MKSRNLFAAAMAAIMIGGVVLAPSVALAQDRGRDNSRQRSSRSDGDRNWSRRGDRSNNQTYQRRNSDRSSNQWNQRREDSDRWRDSDDRSSTPWWQRGNDNDRNHQWRDRDGDRDRDDRNWRDPDHDGDNDARRHSQRRSYNNYNYGYNNYNYGYNDPYYGSSNRNYNYGYGNNYGYSNSDDWRSIADAAGLLAVIGLLDHDNTLFFVGTAGALYSLDRYDRERYSNDHACRLRAEFFSHPYFYRNGRRYDRETVCRNGQDYYRFVCR